MLVPHLKLFDALQKANTDPLQKYVPLKLSAKQRKFYDSDEHEALYGGAAGGGKSVALLACALKYVNVPGYNAIIFRRSYADLSKAGALMNLADQWLSKSDARWDGSRKVWVFPSTATVSFGFLDQANDHYNYQGAEYHCICFDELTQIEPKQYLYLHTRLRGPEQVTSQVNLRIRCGSNPGGRFHSFYKDRFVTRPEDRLFIPARLEDNPGMASQIDAYTKTLSSNDAVTFAQLRYGDWVDSAQGIIYEVTGKNLIEELPPDDPDNDWHFFIGLDWGWRDATAFVVVALRKYDPVMYVVHAESHKKWTIVQIHERLKELERQFGGFEMMISDPGSKQLQETLVRDYFWPMSSAEKTHKAGTMKMLAGEITSVTVKFLKPAVKPLLKECEELQWKDEAHEAEHPRFDNHCCDAFLYVWRKARQANINEQRPKPEPKRGTAEWEAKIADEYIEEYNRQIAEDREYGDALW